MTRKATDDETEVRLFVKNECLGEVLEMVGTTWPEVEIQDFDALYEVGIKGFYQAYRRGKKLNLN
jgi:hypothetical protein